jgi:hypothetical protein
MRFSLFPRLCQCIFCIWVPNMASLSGPFFILTIVMFRGGVGDTSHTPRIFFPKVFPMFTSHYSVSYSLGRIFL